MSRSVVHNFCVVDIGHVNLFISQFPQWHAIIGQVVFVIQLFEVFVVIVFVKLYDISGEIDIEDLRKVFVTIQIP